MRAADVVMLGLLALVAAAAAAMAQPVVLRSGAHDGFDRLVLPFERPVDWRIGRRGADYAVVVTPEPGEPAPAYDLSQVFQRIRPDRLARLTRDPDGALRLHLACACHASAFRFGPGWVVVDVVDGPPPPGSRFEASVDLPEAAAQRPPARPAATPVLPLRLADAASTAVLGPVLASVAPPVPENGGPPVQLTPAEPAPATPPVPDRPDAPAADIAQGVARARAELLVDLERAVDQGLVSVADAATAPPVPLGAPGSPPAAAAPEPDLPAQLDTTTAFDAARAAIGRGTGAVDAPATCPPSDWLDVAAWATDAPATTQIGAARAAVLAEFDKPQPREILRLARLYIHFGFGAEARALLDAFAAPEPEAAQLRRLATIVDFPAAAHDMGLAPHPGCPGPAALWDLLVQPAVGVLGPERLRDALAAFSDLPAHLRRHLGPPIAARLDAAGRRDAAQTVLAAVVRAQTGRDASQGRAFDAARLAEARLGMTGLTEQDLRRIASGTGEEAATALLALAERHLERGAPLPPALRSALAALAFELRGSGLGAALKDIELRTLAAEGEHARAFAGLAEAVAGALRHAPLPHETLPDLLRRLFEDAADAVLAETYFRHRALIEVAALAPDLRRRGAHRLLEAGLTAPAWALLHPPGRELVAEAPEDRLLGAEILVAQNATELAQERIRGLDGPAATALRLRIAEAQGDLAAMQQTARVLGDSGLVSRADLRAGDWAQLRHTGSDSMRQALAQGPELLRDPVAGDATAPEGAAAEQTLAAARAALARSRAARDALRAVLEEVPAPED